MGTGVETRTLLNETLIQARSSGRRGRRLAASPLPEDVGAALVLVFAFALDVEVVGDEGYFLHGRERERERRERSGRLSSKMGDGEGSRKLKGIE